MGRSASIPAWVARRNWNRGNPLWVRRWLDRKPKADRGDERHDADAAGATILPFKRESGRT